MGAVALGCTLLIPASLSFNMRLTLAVSLFTMALMGLKSYMPAFWALPSLILTESAAAGSIGLINSVGNLGGFVGPSLLGELKDTNSLVLAWPPLPLRVDGHLGHDHLYPWSWQTCRRIGSHHDAQPESLLEEEPDAIIEPVLRWSTAGTIKPTGISRPCALFTTAGTQYPREKGSGRSRRDCRHSK